MTMESSAAQQLEAARDLRGQLAELRTYDEQEVIFRETSPRRRIHTLYATDTGEPVKCLEYRLDNWLNKRNADGSFMFTAYKNQAPEYKLGTLKCFMAPDSPEQEILRELGINKVCKAEHIPNEFARKTHAEKKHKAEWRAFMEHQNAIEQAEWREQQKAQTQAMMSLARSAAGSEKRSNPNG